MESDLKKQLAEQKRLADLKAGGRAAHDKAIRGYNHYANPSANPDPDAKAKALRMMERIMAAMFAGTARGAGTSMISASIRILNHLES